MMEPDDDLKTPANNDDTPPTSSKGEENKDGSTDSEPPSFKKLISLARPERNMLIVAFVLMIAAEATSLYNPILLADAYDALINPDLSESERMSDINQTMALVLIIHLAGILAGFFRGSIMSAAGERIVARLRNNVYSSLLKQEIAFFDEHKTGELVSRLGSDTTLIQQATSLAVPEVILGVVKLIVSVALMFWISAALAGVTIGTVSIVFVICVPFGKVIGKLSRSYQDVLGEAQTRSTESLGAMRTVQSFAAENRESARYRDKVGDPDEFPHWHPTGYRDHKTTYSVGYFKSIATTGFFTFIFGFGFGAMYVSLWYGFKLVNDGDITLGQLTAFQSYIFQIGSGLAQTSRYLSQVIEARGASGRVFDLLERIPAIPSPWPKKDDNDENDDKETTNDVETPEVSMVPSKPSFMTGNVELSNVCFSYPSRADVPVLVDFNLTIPANTTAALVGSSGAGKSTVVALLQRFYEVDSGSICIDGNDIRSLDLKWMREHIGYVQQEPQLFGLTVRENICYGVDRDVSDEEVYAASKEANAHDFIMEWPNKYDTMVGERGVKLSGGQKQRVAIARALLVNPRILLLDEVTSALDAESEHLVQEAIDKAVVGRTVLIVAHRLSTIKRADQIVVVDNHRIEDVGTHEILLRRCSKYQDLIKRQSVVRVDNGSGSL